MREALGDAYREYLVDVLTDGQRDWPIRPPISSAAPLKQNEGIAFIGSNVLGEGFLTDEAQARTGSPGIPAMPPSCFLT